MNRLTALDAGFLEAEDSDPHVSLAIGGVAIVEGPPPDPDEFFELLESRITSTPRYRQILRTYPMDIRPPEWVDDVRFDLRHHIHRIALPEPGDDAALFEFVADRMGERLDRERPLWECWVIEGLGENGWAVFIKVHHCIADGITATHLLASLCDEGDTESFADRINAPLAQSSSSAHRVPIQFNPVRWPRTLWEASTDVVGGTARAAKGSVELVVGLLRPSPQSSLTGPIARQRKLGIARVSMADVATVRQAFGVTVNDVALAAISEAYRAVLMGRGEVPDKRALRTLVPVSVRAHDANNDLDNRVSLMLPYLPVDLADPIERLNAVHERLRRAKSGGQRQAGNVFVEAANLVPWTLSAWTVRLMLHYPQRGVVALATNVPGPSRRLHVFGREVQQMLPVPPIALQLRTGIAVLSYADTLAFGVTGDFDSAPDVGQLAAGIEHGVKRLVELSDRSSDESCNE